RMLFGCALSRAAAEGKRRSRSVLLRSTWATPGVSGKSPARAAASPHAPDTARGAASRSAVWLLRRLVGTCTSLMLMHLNLMHLNAKWRLYAGRFRSSQDTEPRPI